MIEIVGEPLNMTKTKIALILLGVIGLTLLLPLTALADGGVTTQPFTTTYEIELDGNWTEANNHPGTATPGPAHFSPLIGASHNSDVVFWAPGTLASPGVEETAELGLTDDFTTEINAEINETPPDALERIFRAGNIDNEATATTNVTVNKDYPLISLISMIAPSSDWFIGLRDQSTLDGSDRWKTSFSQDAFPYDAGTEQDDNIFSLSNDPEDPHKNITNITNGGFFNSNPLGTFTIRRINYSDLYIDKQVSPNTDVTYNTQVIYTIVLSNTGDTTATGANLTDTLPANVSFNGWISQPSGAAESNGVITWNGNVGDGAQVIFSYSATYMGTAVGETITNTAEFNHISANGTNSGYDTASFTVVDSMNPALTITKVADKTEAAPGDTITYTYRVTNTGDVDLSNIVAHDDKLGSVLLDEGSLSVNESASGTMTYTVTTEDLPGPIVNTVTVSGTMSSTTVTASASESVGVIDAVTVTPSMSETTTISSTKGDLVIEAPAGSLPDNASKVKYTSYGTTPTTSETSGLPASPKIGLVFDITLFDGSDSVIGSPIFSPTLKVTISYDQSVIDSLGINEEGLGVFFFDTNTNSWVALTVISRDTDANTITFEVSHLTEFAVVESVTFLYLPLISKP